MFRPRWRSPFSSVTIDIPRAPVGSKTCVGVVVIGPTTGNVELGFSGYTYTP